MYANVIIDISHEQIDRPFMYHIPDSLKEEIEMGCQVLVPFGKGNHLRKAYVIELTEECDYSLGAIKEIAKIESQTVSVEQEMIVLAAWIRKEYGSTMIQALKTVMPVKQKVKQQENKIIVRCKEDTLFEEYKSLAQKRHWSARLRLLLALEQSKEISWKEAQLTLGLSAAVIKGMEQAGVVEVLSEINYRNPLREKAAHSESKVNLNDQQSQVVNEILKAYKQNDLTPCLIHGITGSGKTEVYIRLIEQVVAMGKQAIVLIPEISLTYQTVMRFYSRFHERVSVVNSRLSQGERYDQFERAKNGDIDVMIGPRSALFTPFENLGLIIIDEEQENAYKSEQAPRYHARETAIVRGKLANALVVLGSATPSMEAYVRAKNGEYKLFELTQRAVSGSRLAQVSVVDLREELKAGNRSVFSRLLSKKMEECLAEGSQMMLFLNRRGYSKAVSCRSCGAPVGCPHCAVPLTEHNGSRLLCHYCGYTIPSPKTCPSCGSPYLAGFGMGTQKIELLAKERFPQAKILRMDYDTTSGKEGHETILKAFANHEADILIGTQMIVKGLDFPDVTLVGVLAADMSLYNGDFRSHEKTFQLLTQAAGRAGRSDKEGNVVIQTYDPKNYSIAAAAQQDYSLFFLQERRYRRMMAYPPEGDMCEVLVACQDEKTAQIWIDRIAALINEKFHGTIDIIGPSDAPVAKVRDYWRKHLFFKTGNHEVFLAVMEMLTRIDVQCKKEKVYLSVTAL